MAQFGTFPVEHNYVATRGHKQQPWIDKVIVKSLSPSSTMQNIDLGSYQHNPYSESLRNETDFFASFADRGLLGRLVAILSAPKQTPSTALDSTTSDAAVTPRGFRRAAVLGAVNQVRHTGPSSGRRGFGIPPIRHVRSARILGICRHYPLGAGCVPANRQNDHRAIPIPIDPIGSAFPNPRQHPPRIRF